MLRAIGVPDAEIAGLVVTVVHLTRSGAAHQEALLLDDFYLHGPGPDANAADQLTWEAYDASGVGALEFTCYDETDKVLWKESSAARTLDLHPYRARAAARSWLMCQAKDKAGNLSIPFWMPFPK